MKRFTSKFNGDLVPGKNIWEFQCWVAGQGPQPGEQFQSLQTYINDVGEGVVDGPILGPGKIIREISRWPSVGPGSMVIREVEVLLVGDATVEVSFDDIRDDRTVYTAKEVYAGTAAVLAVYQNDYGQAMAVYGDPGEVAYDNDLLSRPRGPVSGDFYTDALSAGVTEL